MKSMRAPRDVVENLEIPLWGNNNADNQLWILSHYGSVLYKIQLCKCVNIEGSNSNKRFED